MKSTWLSICALAGQLVLAHPNQDCIQAVDLHRSGQFESAISRYQSCLADDPRNVEIRSNLGAALAHLGRYEEAIEQYQTALSSAAPEATSRIRTNLALAYYKSGQIPDATKEFSLLHKGLPDDRNTILLLADCYLLSGAPQKAADLLTPLNDSNSADRTVTYLLGTALIRAGEVSRGQAVLDRILRDGNSAEGHLLLGTGMYQGNDFPRALQEFKQAIAIDSNLPSLHSYLGRSLLRTGDADGASDAFRQELAINPNDFESNLELGQILLVRHKPEEALPFLERSARTRPQSVDAHESLRQAYQALNKTTDAARELAAIQKLRPTLSPAAIKDPSGPHIGDVAPEFLLPKLAAPEQVSLRQYKGKNPVLLVFASYTCPQFREQAETINQMYQKYGKRIQFLLVYIREAHAGENWQSTINEREGVSLKTALTIDEKQDHAGLCRRKLKIEYPAVVDGMDGKAETAYAAWPSRLYLIGRDGRIAYESRLSEFEFQPAGFAAALEKSVEPKSR
jgi:tetratricopeptide (TPR) repeat protein